jgi:hypothetical protein
MGEEREVWTVLDVWVYLWCDRWGMVFVYREGQCCSASYWLEVGAFIRLFLNAGYSSTFQAPPARQPGL